MAKSSIPYFSFLILCVLGLPIPLSPRKAFVAANVGSGISFCEAIRNGFVDVRGFPYVPSSKSPVFIIVGPKPIPPALLQSSKRFLFLAITVSASFPRTALPIESFAVISFGTVVELVVVDIGLVFTAS